LKDSLVRAIEEAEKDFARKYFGETVEISVSFDVDVIRSHDIDTLITQIESGGPVLANRLYDLLQLSKGVPIDVDDLTTLRVWFKSGYPDGEKAVLETLFRSIWALISILLTPKRESIPANSESRKKMRS